MAIYSVTLLLWTVKFSPSCSNVFFRSLVLYRIIILSGKRCLSLPGATLPRVCVVGWVGYVTTTCEPTRSNSICHVKYANTMFNWILSSATCLATGLCVVLRNVTLNASHSWLEITRLHSVFWAHTFGRRGFVVCLTSPPLFRWFWLWNI
jgi:hypothetical protein